MKTSDELLKIINDLFTEGKKEEADYIYNNQYLPLVRKENRKMKKELELF